MKAYTAIALAVALVVPGSSSFGSTERTQSMVEMRAIAHAMQEFAAKYGRFPNGNPSEIVTALASKTHGVGFVPRRLDIEGRPISDTGREYIILHDDRTWCLVGLVAKDGIGLEEYVLRTAPIKSRPAEQTISDSRRPSEAR